MSYTRYAIYAAPDGELGNLGARWLGWDAETAATLQHPEVPDLPLSIAEITEKPRKYGFHGTLKPPFRLAEGTDRAELERALDEFSVREAAVELDAMHVARIGHFIAMVPDGDTTTLAALAGRIVEAFDPFRAPPSETELARRRSSGLSPAQDSNLSTWGYPYVFDEFRFHLTLTGPLEEATASAIIEPLAKIFDPLAKPFILRDIALFGESEGGQFHLLKRYSLRGGKQ